MMFLNRSYSVFAIFLVSLLSVLGSVLSLFYTYHNLTALGDEESQALIMVSFLLHALILVVIVGCFVFYRKGSLSEVPLKKAFIDVRESENHIRRMLDSVIASIYMKDLNGYFIMVNRRFIDIMGGDEEDYLGKTDFDLFPDALAASYRKNDLEVLEKGVLIEFKERAFNVTSDREFTSVKFPIKDKEGIVFATGGISSDIIGLREAEHVQAEWETHLMHSQKMEMIGQLTGGVAHDFNNILNIIHGNLELLKGRLSEDEESLKRIDNAMKGTTRGAEVTQKLFKFAQKKVYEVRKSNVNSLIKGLEGLVLNSLTSSIHLTVQLDDDLWPVVVDPKELEDAILNLTLNARDSMPDGGTLVIKAENRISGNAHVRENSGCQEGRYVLISVEDTGEGLNEEIKEKAFEPFFTTKEQGQGTGLGLSMVYGFVKRSKGHIEISSEVGEGTLIEMFLPEALEQSL